MLPEPQQRWACNTVSSRSLVLRRQLKGFWKAWYTAPALCPRPLARAVGACRKGHGLAGEAGLLEAAVYLPGKYYSNYYNATGTIVHTGVADST